MVVVTILHGRGKYFFPEIIHMVVASSSLAATSRIESNCTMNTQCRKNMLKYRIGKNNTREAKKRKEEKKCNLVTCSHMLSRGEIYKLYGWIVG